MRIIATITCLFTFAGVSWGVLRFFTKPSGLSRRAAIVGALGAFFGVWTSAVTWTSTAAAPQLLAAVIAHLASALLFWSAVRACETVRLTAIFEADRPVRLVQEGPYRYVRHPFYVSYTIFWLSGWIASASWISLAGVVVMTWIYRRAAREEERKFAASSLAGDYAEYRRRVGGMLPRPRPLTGRSHLSGGRAHIRRA